MTYIFSRPWAVRLVGIAILATIVLAMFALSLSSAQAALTDPSLGLTNFAQQSQLGNQPLPQTTAKIINAFISILGVVAVVIILIGGFKWMTSGGAEEKVGEARQLIMAGIIGLVIVLAAYAIARFVIDQLVTAIS